MTETEEIGINQGANVRIRRVSKRMTQECLAELLGMSSQKLSELERRKEIEDNTLNEIAKKLDTDINWFKTHDPINDVASYVDYSTNNPHENSLSGNSQFSNNNKGEIETIINNPVDEIIKVTDKALALQKEHYETEISLLKQLHEKEKIIALLEQQLEYLSKKK